MSNESVKKKMELVLQKYLPEGTVPYTIDLLLKYPVKFRIVKPRKTKLGDFRTAPDQQIPEITINGDLNKYAFLVTTIHEIAHLKTWMKHKHQVNPHGKEWKQNFIDLMFPVVELNVLPKDVENALINSFTNVKTSSCTDQRLNRVLRNYDDFHGDEILLEEISKNSTFVLQNKVFRKGDLRRTRFLCQELESGKKYLINALATVKLIELNE